MWDFSDDETGFMLVAAAIGVLGVFRLYLNIVRAGRWKGSMRSRVLLALTPVASLLLLYTVLCTLADPIYVAGRFDYTLLFMAGGAMWIVGAAEGFAMLGISARDDALERGNFPAAIAIAGGIFAVILVYAGSNVGNGPTIWTTLWPALVATISLALLWGIVELFGGARDAITIDRDPAAAIRMAGLSMAAGAILGRAMTGDWHDWSGTFKEFIQLGWPAALIALAAVMLNYFLAPTPTHPRPPVVSHGLLPAAVAIACSAAYIISLGWPLVAPKGQYKP